MNNCSFNTVSLNGIKKELQNIGSSKVTQQVSDIPTKIIKENLDILFLLYYPFYSILSILITLI